MLAEPWLKIGDIIVFTNNQKALVVDQANLNYTVYFYISLNSKIIMFFKFSWLKIKYKIVKSWKMFLRNINYVLNRSL